MKPRAQRPTDELPVDIVGSNNFGRYNKISDEKTFNMIMSDGFLVPYPGYKKFLEIEKFATQGRGSFASSRGGFLLAVVDNTVYKIQGLPSSPFYQPIFNLNTFYGRVFIDENNAGQIAICDGNELWIYNWINNTATIANLPINPESGIKIKPGYVVFHDGYFIVPDITSRFWYLSDLNDGLDWFWGASGQAVSGAVQTKPGNSVAVVRSPGQGKMIYVFGQSVVEIWHNQGQQIFPYVKNTSANVDYGCASPDTIDTMDEMVAWLATNEKSGLSIMIAKGANSEKISTDGIDFKLGQVKNPQASTAFFFRESGHVFYQITFTDPQDNFSLVYDFSTQRFFSPTDEKMNYHIARSVSFYNNAYYFTSLNDGGLYQLSSNYTNYDYRDPDDKDMYSDQIKTIPRVRVCKNIRMKDASKFVGIIATITIEQGADEWWMIDNRASINSQLGQPLQIEGPEDIINDPINTERVNKYIPSIDLSLSKDSGVTFSSYTRQEMNTLGKRVNRINFYQLGMCNELTLQFRFNSYGRIVVTDGVLQIRHADVGRESRGK